MQLFSNSSSMVSNSRSIIVIRCSKQNHIRFFCRCHNRIQLFITAINFGIADSKCWGKSCSSPAQQLQSWTNCRKQSIPAVQRYPWTEQTCHSALPVQAVFLLSGIRSKIWQQTFPPQAAEDIVFYSSIPLIYRKIAYFLDDIIDGNRFINDEVPTKNSGLSPVSISVGVAFTDRKKSSRFIFKDADKALYLVKENSRRGCAIEVTPKS